MLIILLIRYLLILHSLTFVKPPLILTALNQREYLIEKLKKLDHVKDFLEDIQHKILKSQDLLNFLDENQSLLKAPDDKENHAVIWRASELKSNNITVPSNLSSSTALSSTATSSTTILSTTVAYTTALSTSNTPTTEAFILRGPTTRSFTTRPSTTKALTTRASTTKPTRILVSTRASTTKKSSVIALNKGPSTRGKSIYYSLGYQMPRNVSRIQKMLADWFKITTPRLPWLSPFRHSLKTTPSSKPTPSSLLQTSPKNSSTKLQWTKPKMSSTFRPNVATVPFISNIKKAEAIGLLPEPVTDYKDIIPDPQNYNDPFASVAKPRTTTSPTTTTAHQPTHRNIVSEVPADYKDIFGPELKARGPPGQPPVPKLGQMMAWPSTMANNYHYTFNLYNEMHYMGTGYFSVGARNLCVVIAEKEPNYLHQVLQHLEYIVNNMQLTFGEPLTTCVRRAVIKVSRTPVNNIQRNCAMFAGAMVYRRQTLNAGLNYLLDFSDSLTTQNYGIAIADALADLKDFPQGGIPDYQICDALVKAFIGPFGKRLDLVRVITQAYKGQDNPLEYIKSREFYLSGRPQSGRRQLQMRRRSTQRQPTHTYHNKSFHKYSHFIYEEQMQKRLASLETVEETVTRKLIYDYTKSSKKTYKTNTNRANRMTTKKYEEILIKSIATRKFLRENTEAKKIRHAYKGHDYWSSVEVETRKFVSLNVTKKHSVLRKGKLKRHDHKIKSVEVMTRKLINDDSEEIEATTKPKRFQPIFETSLRPTRDFTRLYFDKYKRQTSRFRNVHRPNSFFKHNHLRKVRRSFDTKSKSDSLDDLSENLNKDDNENEINYDYYFGNKNENMIKESLYKALKQNG